jgi:hypothetical protein
MSNYSDIVSDGGMDVRNEYEMERKSHNMNEAADKIKGLIDIQKQNGNYNYNEFMYGMLVGMEAVYYSLLEKEAQYTEKPEKWLKDSIHEDYLFLKTLVPEAANVQRVNMYGEVIPQYPFDTSY